MPGSPERKTQRRRAQLDVAIRTLDALKIAAGCTDCGYRAHPQALHFDHRDPSTKRTDLGWADDRSRLVTAERLRRYLDHVATYCDVRCANCHAIRTTRERHWLPPSRAPETGPPALF